MWIVSGSGVNLQWLQAPGLCDAGLDREKSLYSNATSSGSQTSLLATGQTEAEGRIVNVIEFFEYLAASEQTKELASDLADAWAAHEVEDVYTPAA